MRLIAILAVALLAACAEPISPNQPQVANTVQLATPDSYVVMLNTGKAADVAKAAGITPQRTYGTLNGFAATLNASQVEALKHNPNVQSVSVDGIMVANTVPSWGLDRIDQRLLPLNDSYSAPNDGSGVHVYITDTGIRFTHSDFEGRASLGFDIDGSTGIDCNGHGTHVAGTVGGKTYGVAKKVSLVAVKIFSGCGSSAPMSYIVAGLDWVAAHAIKPAVVSMSLGGGIDPAMNTAVARLDSLGISVVVAAGNSGLDACNYSPASAPSAITVGSTTSADIRSSFSNKGPCVDLFAPGSSITSSWYTSDIASAVLSGTSMATPHVSGVAALILHDHPGFTPAQVDSTIKARSTKGVVIDAQSDNFNLLYSGLDDDLNTPEPPPLPPAPAAPSNVRDSMLAVYDTYSTMNLRWNDNSSNEDGFVIRGTKGTSEFHSVGIGPNTTSINFNLSPGTWTVTVSAYNAGGENTSSSIQMCVPSTTAPCGSPPPPPDTVAPPDTTTPPPTCRMRGKSGKCK